MFAIAHKIVALRPHPSRWRKSQAARDSVCSIERDAISAGIRFQRDCKLGLYHARRRIVSGELCPRSADFAETTNKQVAAAAGVDMASINYHFGTRAGLYQAVLIEAHRRLIDHTDIEALSNAGQPVHDKLRALIDFVVASASGKDRWPALVLFRELAAPSPNIEVLRDREILPKLQLLIPILSDISGIPPEAPALLVGLPAIAAPCLALLMIGDHLRFPGDILPPAREVLAQYFFTFAIGGLEAVGDDFRKKHKASSR